MALNIFEVMDKSGRNIRLTVEQWKHIQTEHPGVDDPEELKQTLIAPVKITPSKYNPENVRYYYRFIKGTKRYLMVAVKYLNGDGFVVTSYFMRNIQ